MTSWQATTFLIGEYFTDDDPNPIFTVADGLIWLRQSVQRNSMVRKMEIMKMRGQPTLAGPAHLPHRRAGVQRVCAAAAGRPADAQARPATSALKMGVPGLDEMMGGGLPRGYSLLVAGPSGSGKSILASAFSGRGRAPGETGVIAAFEQRPNRSAGRRWPTDRQRQRRRDRRARAGLSVDEIATLLIAGGSTRLKGDRVVIDSLSGFELALRPTFRDGLPRIAGPHGGWPSAMHRSQRC
jgi:circadian clock protein KaiC